MNPLVLFDYVYYSIARFYSSVFDMDDQKRFAGISLLSLFQSFNIITVYEFFFFNKNTDPIHFIIASYIVMFIFNSIRYYFFVRYEMLASRWISDKLLLKIVKIILTICYIIFSVAFMIIGSLPKSV